MCQNETTAHLFTGRAEDAAGESTEAVQDRIDQIVREHEVVLFMKGTPAQPQCGFSAATLKVLGHYAVNVHTVDVLADPALGQGIKVYTDWPTIPQLYVGGVFVGGCDIVRAMHSEGSLAAVLGARLRTERAA